MDIPRAEASPQLVPLHEPAAAGFMHRDGQGTATVGFLLGLHVRAHAGLDASEI